jgi:hypothetical protein
VAITTDTTYANAYRADNLGDVKPSILIGGKTEKFVPNVNISFELESSKEQYFLNINRSSVTVDSVTVDKEISSLVTDKLSLSIGNETDIWHIDENGNFEWDIEFKQKPSTNVFSWALTHTEGLSFYYQPALTQADIDNGTRRPDNVVGSYAVYCNKTGHYKDADGKTTVNYRTGKLLHIYRPLCIDAKGNKEWAELLIEKGTLTITIPQKFLNTAVYPVTLDPTFGYTSIGATEDYMESDWLYGLYAAAVSSGGTATSITLRTLSYWDNIYFKGVLVDHTGDTIVSNGVGGATNVPNDETSAWRTSNFATSPTITNGTTYYPCAIFTGTVGKANCDSVSNSSGIDYTNSYTTPQNPTWTDRSYKWSIYCTYTESGGGGASSVPLFDYYFNNMRP